MYVDVILNDNEHNGNGMYVITVPGLYLMVNARHADVLNQLPSVPLAIQ